MLRVDPRGAGRRGGYLVIGEKPPLAGAKGHRAPSARHGADSLIESRRCAKPIPSSPPSGVAGPLPEPNTRARPRPWCSPVMWSAKGIHRAPATAAARTPYRSSGPGKPACSRFLQVDGRSPDRSSNGCCEWECASTEVLRQDTYLTFAPTAMWGSKRPRFVAKSQANIAHLAPLVINPLRNDSAARRDICPRNWRRRGQEERGPRDSGAPFPCARSRRL